MTGQIEVDLPAREAIRLFTPEGERDWVPGWDPTYPAGERSETPGTVFITKHGDAQAIWLIQELDTDECTAAYSRITPGHHAGTVRVRCDDNRAGGCIVSVTYDMSLLPGGNPTALDPYDDHHFGAMMSEWSQLVSNHLHPGQQR